MPDNPTGLPISFRPRLFNLLVGLAAGLLFSTLSAVQYTQHRGALEAAMLGVTGIVLAGLVLELLKWAAWGPVQYMVDADGLHKGRGHHPKLLFAWSDVLEWTRHMGPRTHVYWRFKLPGRIVVVRSHNVESAPFGAEFEAAVAQASGKLCNQR